MTHTNENHITTVHIKILGRDLKIRCPNSEVPELESAIALVESKIKTSREKDTVASSDAVAILTALNIAHELIIERKHSGNSGKNADTDMPDDKIDMLLNKIQRAIEKN